MKKVILILLFFYANFSFGNMQVFLKPGIDFYSDKIGYNGEFGLQADLNPLLFFVPSGFFAGFTVGIFGSSLSNFYFLGENLNLNIGYHFNIAKNFTISPYLSGGGGHIDFWEEPKHADKWLLSIAPSIEFQILLNDNFSVGIDSGYRFFTLDIGNGGVLTTSLRFTYLFSDPQNHSKKTNSNQMNLQTNSSTIINLVKKPIRKYPAAEIQQMTVSEITALAKWAIQENESEYAKLLVKEGLVKEPDNPELLSILTNLMNKK
jgi:hypothetical protein